MLPDPPRIDRRAPLEEVRLKDGGNGLPLSYLTCADTAPLYQLLYPRYARKAIRAYFWRKNDLLELTRTRLLLIGGTFYAFNN